MNKLKFVYSGSPKGDNVKSLILSVSTNQPKTKKPKYVYHASPNRNIKEFEPRKRTSRDQIEPPVVFAAPRKDIAVGLMLPADDSWVRGGSVYPKDKTWYIVISDKERYLGEDKGGAIHTLPSETFENDPNKGLSVNEWVSYVPVKPTNKKEGYTENNTYGNF